MRSIHFVRRTEATQFLDTSLYSEDTLGLYDFKERRVIVFTDAPKWGQLLTLVHEYCHYLIHIFSCRDKFIEMLLRQGRFDYWWWRGKQTIWNLGGKNGH